MIIEIRISAKDLKLISEEMEAGRPYEACGILVGRVQGNTAVVEKTIPAYNIKKSRTRFEIDPAQLYEVWDASEREGKEIVGIYHTHPFSQATPSNWDREYMEANPVVWIICGVDGVKGYIWDEGKNNIRKIHIKTF
jgi:proteasome lid subunit RPN8/RPN11